MRRTLLSCTSLARNGLLGGALAALLPAAPAEAADLIDTLSIMLDFNRQELAVLATALALLGFSVVAAILLMRTRVRTAKNEARLRARIGELQLQADRFGALLFAEPQILISWPAGDNRAQISGDISLVLPRDSSPQRVLAFGTWLPPEPALLMDHAVDALRDRGDGFQLTLTTAHGHTLEAIGRAIGGQAIVRIREPLRSTARPRRDQSALQGADGRDRDAARLRSSGAVADLGQGRERRAHFRQPGLCPRDRGGQRHRCTGAQARAARQRRPHRDGARPEGHSSLHLADADRDRRRAAHL